MESKNVTPIPSPVAAARPCPFYTRGNCLFSASCNFIHTVKSPVAPEVRITEASIREATSDDGSGLPPSKSRGGAGIGGNATLNNNSHKDGYDAPSTPPNVISPPFSDDTPPETFAPQPSIWGSGRRRYSWAPSIRSISSAGSNLTYPTDLSPTASYMSENDDDIDGIDDDEDERPELDGLEVVAAYGLPSANNPNDTFEFVRSRPVSNATTGTIPAHARSQSVTNDDDNPVRPARLSQSTINAAVVSSARVAQYQPTRSTVSFRLPPEDGVPEEEPKVVTPASAISDPDGQVLDVKSPAPLGDAFVLRSPKPRRTKSSKTASSLHQDSDIEYDDEGLGLSVEEPTVKLTDATPSPPRPESPEQEALEEMFLHGGDASATLDRPLRRSGDRQLSLNEVFLNLQDPSSRPRRIDRIMQGLSPETPINSVLPTSAISATSQRPAPFQGDGDRKSTAFREHLATLMAKRSAQLSDPDWEKNQGRLKRIAVPAPGSAPATKTQFGLGDAQRQQTLPPLPESAAPRLKMFDAFSPDGVNPAFTRPRRPGHRKRNAGGQGGTPATSGSISVPSASVPASTRNSPPTTTTSPALRESPPPLPPSASLTYLSPLASPAQPTFSPKQDDASPSPPLSASLTHLSPSASPSQPAFSPKQAASPQLSPQVVEPRKLSPPPPSTPKRRRRRPSSSAAERDGGPSRMGSVTGTPVHDSPEDFRGLKERQYFSPLEEDDAQAAMSVVGVYEGGTAEGVRESVVGERRRSSAVPVVESRRSSAAPVVEKRMSSAAPVNERRRSSAAPVNERRRSSAAPVDERRRSSAVPVTERRMSEAALVDDDVQETESETHADSGSETGSVPKDRGESIGLGRPPPASRRRTSKSSRSNASSGAPSTEHTVRNVSKPVPTRTFSAKSSRVSSINQGPERTETLLLAPEDGIPRSTSRDFTPRVHRIGTSAEDGITPKAKSNSTHSRGNSFEKRPEEEEEEEEDTVPPVPQLLPAADLALSPKFQPRPLRLSRLFEQVQNTAPQSLPEPLPSLPGTATPSSVRSRQSRRPLSAIFMTEDEENIDSMPNSARIDSHQIPPSPTPRRPQQQVNSPFHAFQSPAFSHTPPGSAGYPFTSTPQTSSSNRIRSDSISEEPVAQPSPFVFPSSRPGIPDMPLVSPASSIRSRQSRTAHLPYLHNAGFVPKHTPRSSATTPVTSASSKTPTSSLQPAPLSGRHSRHLSVESAVSAASSAASSAVAKPLLFFAIASDDVKEVERLLSSGEANANDRAGPDDLPALLFTMGNEGLKNKNEIIKTLLAYGADPSVLQQFNGHANRPSTSSHPSTGSQNSVDDEGGEDRRSSVMTVRQAERSKSPSPTRQITMGMNPEIDYYLTRVTEMPEKQLDALRKAGFDPLARMPFKMIGQDLVLQELLRVLARHSARGGSTPVSIIFAGPSGHGKSFLSRSIGELLRIPAHTVNMTNLRTQDEFLQARSLTSKNGEVSLASFLSANEGKRCAVILEEIEKVADKSASNTLLMPWELGKLNTTARQYDTSRVIWISTSNAGEDIVFDFERDRGDRPCDRKEYLDLATRIRRNLIQSLGASLVSRITTVLPFLAFTHAEKLALAYQSLPSDTSLSKEELDTMLDDILADYIPSEGVRSIQRAVQRHYEDDMW
ncbi:hypothetical protein FRC04_004658 [Tulasnella sp. 424]|nr:hypothetical protein FRC04_004658 [Tulasnella sp. 424]